MPVDVLCRSSEHVALRNQFQSSPFQILNPCIPSPCPGPVKSHEYNFSIQLGYFIRTGLMLPGREPQGSMQLRVSRCILIHTVFEGPICCFAKTLWDYLKGTVELNDL
jgi:hypothetical protein